MQEVDPLQMLFITRKWLLVGPPSCINQESSLNRLQMMNWFHIYNPSISCGFGRMAMSATSCKLNIHYLHQRSIAPTNNMPLTSFPGHKAPLSLQLFIAVNCKFRTKKFTKWHQPRAAQDYTTKTINLSQFLRFFFLYFLQRVRRA